MIKVFITTNFEIDDQSFLTNITCYILEDMWICGICILVYTRRYVDMWNMYTCIHEKICGICILVYTRRYVDMWNMYTCIHEKICGYVEMFYNDWLVS